MRDGMENLFDPDKPYFEAWVQLHDIDAKHRDDFQNMPDSEPGSRRLYYAAMCGFYKLVEHLTVKSSQYASARGGICGTALHSASFEGHFQVVRHLLQHGVDVNVRNTGNDTPLLLASWKGHRDMVECLLEHGAVVDLPDLSQNTPLILAATHEHVDVVRILLPHDADVDVRNLDHESSLVRAAEFGIVDIVRVLLEHNADPHSQDHRSRTPLHWATLGNELRGDYPRVVRLLLEHGANANARDCNLQTPLHLASKRPTNLDVLRILLEHGADIDAEDKDGKTPLQLSTESGHDKVTRLLSGNYPSKG